MMVSRVIAGAFVGALLMVAGCTSSTNDDGDAAPAVVVEVDGLGPSQYMTFGSWNANALSPSQSSSNANMRGWATLGGPTGQTTQWSVCLLRLTTTTCNTPTDCAATPNPYGGPVTCVAPDHVGQQYCAVRPGPASQVCAGSTVMGGAGVGPGTYLTPQFPATVGETYISSACFGACNNSNRSASPAAVRNACTFVQNGWTCEDMDCDGFGESCCRVTPQGWTECM